MEFAITSGSKHKVAALDLALERLGITADVIVCKGESGQNEQPEGQDQAYRGAYNRITTCGSKGSEAIVSIENGIHRAKDQSVKDFAVVMIETSDNRFVWALSQTVDFPSEQYDKAKAAGFDKHTVGSFLEADGVVQDGTDPHLELSGMSRIEILAGPLIACLTKLGYGSAKRLKSI